MAQNKSNKYTSNLKTGYFKQNQTVSKFQPVLVKDILQNFGKEMHNTTDAKGKGNSKVHRNFDKNVGISQKSVSNCSSNVINNNSNQIIRSECQKTRIGECNMKVKHDNFAIPCYHKNHSKSTNFLNSEKSSLENLSVNDVPCNCANKVQSCINSVTDLKNTIDIVQNVVDQLKIFLVQSVKAHEDQVSKLKQILNNVNDISNVLNKSDSSNRNISTFYRNSQSKIATSSTTNNKDSLAVNVKTIDLNLSKSVLDKDKNRREQSAELNTKQRQIPLIKLVNTDDSFIEVNESSRNHSKNIVQLPVTVSGVVDLLNKADIESQINCLNIANSMPKSAKSLRRRTMIAKNCEFQGRRRSLSTPSESDLDVTEGFTMLEKKLNIVHKKPVKLLSTSPMNASPSTPAFATQWDKRSQQPLKEYMELKMQSSFLATPTANWFQSRLQSIDVDDL